MADAFVTPSPFTPRTPIGREREIALLRQRLAALLAGQGGLILIAGEAGIGKTDLVNWFAAETQTAGGRFFGGHCYGLTQTPPYGPWREALAGLGSDRTDPPHRSPFAADPTTVTSQSSLFDHVQDGLASVATRQPLLLVLEDLHWSDPASLELLRYVARGVASLPVLLVATYRGDEVAPKDPLFALLPHLVRETDAERITLGPSMRRRRGRWCGAMASQPPMKPAWRRTSSIARREIRCSSPNCCARWRASDCWCRRRMVGSWAS
jgi:predicted ATPase